MKFKKNDIVKMIRGKDKGRTGRIVRVFPKINKIVVENLNLVKKRVKSRKAGQPSETISLARKVDASQAMIVCPSCHQPARIGYKLQNNTKYRYCKKCGSRI
jgi:large subunit ribosomal protein L24